MKKIALLFLGLLFTQSALAADNAVIVTPGVGVTMKSKDIGAGVQAMQPVLSDASGNTLLTTVGADAVSNTLTGIPTYSRTLFYNGTTWDRWQGAVTATLAAETTKVIGTVRVASGGIASGSIASGAVASGAVASGAVASGAYAAGSIASGAMVDLGAQADAAWASGSGSLIAVAKTIAGNTAAAVPAGTARIGYVSDDPCTQKAKTNLPISQNGVSSVQLIALSGATVIYVCSLSLIAAGATTVALTTGTGTACATGNAAVIGATTANIANSMSLAANGGLTLGNGGGTVAQGAASSQLCMILGTSVFVSGNLTYVQQ